MTIIKKAAVILAMAFAFSANSVAVAEEAAAESAASSQATAADIISNIELGLAEVQKSDFSAAQVKLKAARFASDSIRDSSPEAAKAHAILMQGQISAKKGNVAVASEQLTEALELYKGL